MSPSVGSRLLKVCTLDPPLCCYFQYFYSLMFGIATPWLASYVTAHVYTFHEGYHSEGGTKNMALIGS